MAAWAGAEVRAMPAVAAATAAVVRAFFGEAMRRMRETGTENLLRRGRECREQPEPAGAGGGAALAPKAPESRMCPGSGDRRLLTTSSRQAGGASARKHPFY
ncbi:hypothetical protein GCM10014715_36140 [Streptomyces spiralis]|uniref:Uncharacterized protein n=1 Tax=Streptomyces spiralis TaxID=66376 RepID=A0A918ZZY3_9ACTN|nr:hypothetical protein GCM10014715_36140 [Streptomyces spiralis]